MAEELEGEDGEWGKETLIFRARRSFQQKRLIVPKENRDRSNSRPGVATAEKIRHLEVGDISYSRPGQNVAFRMIDATFSCNFRILFFESIAHRSKNESERKRKDPSQKTQHNPQAERRQSSPTVQVSRRFVNAGKHAHRTLCIRDLHRLNSKAPGRGSCAVRGKN